MLVIKLTIEMGNNSLRVRWLSNKKVNYGMCKAAGEAAFSDRAIETETTGCDNNSLPDRPAVE